MRCISNIKIVVRGVIISQVADSIDIPLDHFLWLDGNTEMKVMFCTTQLEYFAVVFS